MVIFCGVDCVLFMLRHGHCRNASHTDSILAAILTVGLGDLFSVLVSRRPRRLLSMFWNHRGDKTKGAIGASSSSRKCQTQRGTWVAGWLSGSGHDLAKASRRANPTFRSKSERLHLLMRGAAERTTLSFQSRHIRISGAS